MNEKIQKILEAGILAPSGENCQPWLVRIDQDRLALFNDPAKDMSLYNHNQKGSMVALGAFIENLVVASKTVGLVTQIDMFPDSSDENFIASISFSSSNTPQDILYDSIFKRASNRKAYKKVNITDELKSSIINSAKEITGGQVSLIYDVNVIKNLSDPISLNEQLIFENPFLHDFFYQHVRWTKQEDEKYRNGFYIKTLELNFAQKFIMKILKSWKWAERAKKIEISKQVAKDNAKNYSASSALGIVSIPTNSRRDYVTAGRIMERIWLKVTSAGLSLQPMTGVIFFMQRIFAGETKEFSAQEVELIKKAYYQIENSFDVKGQTIAMLFRIGDGGEPSARSPRFEISQILKV